MPITQHLPPTAYIVPPPATTILDCFTAALRAAVSATPALRLAAPQLPGAAAALAAWSLRRLHPQATVLVVAPGPTELEALHADLLAFAHEAGAEPLFFPAYEGDDPASDPELSGVRFATLRKLREGADRKGQTVGRLDCQTVQPFNRSTTLLATCVHALQQPVPDPAAIENVSIQLNVGAEYLFDEVVAKLVANGYERVVEVSSKGELAVRGGLLDVWPVTAPMPLRAEFFGATLESLRNFDPGTQGSVEKCATAWLPPCKAMAISSCYLTDLLSEGNIIIWLDHDRLQDFAQTRAPDTQAADNQVARARRARATTQAVQT